MRLLEYVILLFTFVLMIATSQRVTGDVSVTLGEYVLSMSGFALVYAFPLIILSLYLLLRSLPEYAVYQKHIRKFFEEFPRFSFWIIYFFFLYYVVLVLPIYGVVSDVLPAFVVVLAFMYAYVGFALQHIHRNYFIGFMTPWSLSSDRIWNKTQYFGGAVLQVCGALLLLSILFPSLLLGFVIVSSIVCCLLVGLYSYWLFAHDHEHHG